MNEFFDGIAQAFTLIVDFVVNTITTLLLVLELIARSVVVVFKVIYYMPVVIQVILIALISYIIIINLTQKGG